MKSGLPIHVTSLLGSEAHLSTLLLSRPGRRLRPAQWLLLVCERIAKLFPQRLYRRGTQVAIDCCAAACAVFLAYQFRFDFDVPATYARGMWLWILIMGIIRPAAFISGGTYKVPWRWVHLRDLTGLVLVSIPASLILLSLRLTLRQTSWAADIPIGVIALELATFVGLASGIRGLRRLLHEETQPFPARRKPALLLGSEETLAATLAQMRTLPELEIVGLVAPGAHLKGFRIRQVPVVGEPAQLSTILANAAIQALVIADAIADWAPGARSAAANFGIDVHLLPSAANVMRGQVRVATPVDPDSILETQTTVDLPAPAVIETYRNRTVLVTGAGGSIGLELCRQVLDLGIARLILLDHDESAVFEADRELQSATAELVPVVGDIRDEHLLRHVFAHHKPEIVLHSAAFKHVPVMESNASEAVLNNIIGTRQLLDKAIDFGAERFLMISSDKAVNPASVMGATKRVAEMLVQSRAMSARGTKFASVRFGNVAGSRGSVIPIFLKQIAEGEPITVTDERMSRYFMTVKEAVQLVLQASSLASSGEIYMLDMGEPIMITGLARKLIEMSGLRPHKDIPLKTIGIRPGEKLHERLWCEGSQISPTEFPRVYCVDAGQIPEQLEADIAELEQIALARNNDEVLEQLRSMPIEYQRESRNINNQPA